MKTPGKFIIRIVTVVVLLLQLMSPTLARADGETPPPPSETATPPVTPPPTDVAPTESPTAEETSPTPTELASPTDDPVETVTSTETPVPQPIESPTETVPTELPTDEASPTNDPVETNTPAETATFAPPEATSETPLAESPTPDFSTGTSVPVATDPPVTTPTDPASPTVDPVETNTGIPTLVETTEPSADTPEASSTPMPVEPTAETVTTESSTPTETPTHERTPRTPESPTSTPEATETASPSATVTVDQPTLLESVDAVGVDTSVVVLDANGQPLPLVTQEAANIVANPDPVWCPDDPGPPPMPRPPTPNLNGCTASYTSLATLLFDLSALNGGTGINANGTIWIEASYDSSVNDFMATGFTLDGSILTTWAHYSLTLQGGWDGVSGSTVLLSNSVFSVPITITNWHKKVKINDLTINTTSAVTAGLTVVTDGNINLSNINVTNSAGDGVSLNNIDPGRGNVTVNNLTTNNNAGTGLTVVTNGDVSLNGISIDGTNGTGTGLYVNSGGAINGTNITSINNNTKNGPCPVDCGNGAFLVGATGVTLTGTNVFTGNDWTGLDAWSSNGNITLENIIADNNHGYGAFLTGANGVTLTGTNEFSGNGQTGLDAWSNYGDVTLNNVTASNNHGYGAAIHGADVTLTGNSVFNANPAGGLVVFDSGNVTLNDVNAAGSNNGIQSYGVIIFDSGNVYLTGGTYTGNGTGLYVECVESVTFNIPLTEIINNTVQDIYIDPTCPVPVTYPKPTIISISHSEKEFVLDCKSVDGFSVNLPNGDLVYIYCPVTGNARIARLDSTALPADLPAGFTYASAFSLDILQNKEPIDVITEGGSIKASFVGSSLQPGSTYSILYWDNGSWEPLEEFMLDVKGKPLAFDLNPGVPEDIRQILSGVELVTVNGLPRVEVSTNFPGIFVLAQR